MRSVKSPAETGRALNTFSVTQALCTSCTHDITIKGLYMPVERPWHTGKVRQYTCTNPHEMRCMPEACALSPC